MERLKKEEKFRKFEGRLKILAIRARVADDGKKDIYEDLVKKLETIREKRHLAMMEEENEESILYSQLLDIVGNEEDYQKILEDVSNLLSEYNPGKNTKIAREINDGEER